MLHINDAVCCYPLSIFILGYSGGNAGGSHAGEGGVTTEASKAGETYGDFRRPTTAGSGGRLTQPGGALNIKGITVTIAGTLRAK